MASILHALMAYELEMKEWFEHMHRHPELSMQERETARYIEGLVRQWGYDVETDIGRHGIVASMTVGQGTGAIGLRADFDALPIQEQNALDYRSEVDGVAHLCGHDGHTTMLLGAGRYLAESRNFSGTVRLIFQPGEETMEGGPAMIRDGLFTRFPMDAVFGMHNMPGLELGKLYFSEGEAMAAVDHWEIELTGKGGHGAMPELAVDTVVAGSALVMALQTIVARNVSPHNSAVVTVGAFQSGNAGNVIAQSAVLRLSIRSKTQADRDLVTSRVRHLTRTHAEAYNCSYEIREKSSGAVLVNDAEETRRAAGIARAAFGGDQVIHPGPTFLASEDFAFMLEERKGTYCFIGNGDTHMVHHPQFLLDQRILAKGAAYWAALTESYLS